MRVVILCSSVYSETACAMAVRLAETGQVPVGALALSTFNRDTLLRKIGQWGVREAARYARGKLFARAGEIRRQAHNPYLHPLLKHSRGVFRSLGEISASYRFPLSVCSDQNSETSIRKLKKWSPDLIIFAGGNILRTQLLEVPRLGVVNSHLGLLPEIRGMSSPEWSLVRNVPVGVTIHYMDAGIDTGPVLQRYEFPDVGVSESLGDLRNRLIAFGVEKVAEVVSALDHEAISATPQPHLGEDRQFFVMHEWLQARAVQCLAKHRSSAVPVRAHG